MSATPNTPEVKVPVEMTDPEALRKAVRGVFGEEIATMMRDNLQAAIKEFGLDKVDRAHLTGMPAAPTKQRFTVADCIDVDMVFASWASDEVKPLLKNVP